MAIKVLILENQREVTVTGLYQWDYGQVIEIECVEFGSEIMEVHFACQGMTEALVRPCSFANGVGTVTIPDRCLEQSGSITAWVYEINGTQGHTVKTIILPVVARTRPSKSKDMPPEYIDKYAEALTEINEAINALEEGNVAVAKAEKADEAAHATTADSAKNASYATSAGTASYVQKAATADYATTAENAKNATYATTAVSADKANTATNATNATNANLAASASKLALPPIDKSTLFVSQFQNGEVILWDKNIDEGMYLAVLSIGVSDEKAHTYYPNASITGGTYNYSGVGYIGKVGLTEGKNIISLGDMYLLCRLENDVVPKIQIHRSGETAEEYRKRNGLLWLFKIGTFAQNSEVSQMRNLHIAVNDKIATYDNRDGIIVCGNGDYQLVINFDADWDSIATRTARFIWNDQHKDVDFAGDTVSVPVVNNTQQLIVGIYADGISTTAVAIPCVLSVLCEGA